MSTRSLRRAAHQRTLKEQKRARRRTVGLALGVGAAAGISLVPIAPAQAATIAVTTLASSGAGSLAQAVLDANAATGPDTITFDPSLTGTISLTQEILITDSLSITGPGAGRVAVDGGDTTRIFNISGSGADRTTAISGLILKRGNASISSEDNGYGGAVYSSVGDLTLQDDVFTDNQSSGADGGAVAAYGTGGAVTITGSTFTYNTSADDGGAVYLNSNTDVIITDSTFDQNTANDDGGAIYNTGATSTVITGSTFTGNIADSVTYFGLGGAIDQAGGTFTMTSTEVSGNTAINGGGVYLGSGETATIDRSTFTANTATLGGGLQVANATGDFTMSDSVVSGNNSPGSGGGIYLYASTAATIIDSTVSDNTASDSAGGLLIGSVLNTSITSPVDIVNSTISGNSLDRPGPARGAGVYAFEADGEGSLTFTHSTIAGNGGSGISSEDANVTIEGSIVADNTVDLVKAQGSQAQFALDYSLVESPDDGVTRDVTPASNLIGVDPQLGALADNGGPTQTMLPAATSPALDAATADGTTVDQRGLDRPADLPGTANAAGGDASDMGAVELQNPKPPTTSAGTTPAPPAAATGSCDGAVATIVAKPGVPTFGTPGRDVIVGTAGADSISGGGGDDLICGLGGDDAIDTGAGRNRVFGGDGNDLIRGGASRDVLFGDAGDDRIYGGRANDTIDGGAGNDTVRGNRGNDKIKGGGGKDSLRGGKNRDTLTGGPGKDKVRGGQAKDKVKS